MIAILLTDVLMWIFLICVACMLTIMAGEIYVAKHPNSKFKKWWRKHIVEDTPYDSY